MFYYYYYVENYREIRSFLYRVRRLGNTDICIVRKPTITLYTVANETTIALNWMIALIKSVSTCVSVFYRRFLGSCCVDVYFFIINICIRRNEERYNQTLGGSVLLLSSVSSTLALVSQSVRISPSLLFRLHLLRVRQ